MIKQINTDTAPQASGPYSQAVSTDTLIFCSGQIGLDPKTGELVDGIENQTRQVMKNLSEVLSASGSGFSSVLKTTIYLKNISDFTIVNGVYGEYFTDHKPARATFAVLDLPKGALIEIEAIASV